MIKNLLKNNKMYSIYQIFAFNIGIMGTRVEIIDENYLSSRYTWIYLNNPRKIIPWSLKKVLLRQSMKMDWKIEFLSIT